MNFHESLNAYAKLIVQTGVNLQKDQILCINAPISAAPLARLVAKNAYIAGAREVSVKWSDDEINRLRFTYEPVSHFKQVEGWLSAYQNGYARQDAAFLTIDAADPEALLGIDPQKPAARTKAVHIACKEFYDALDLGRNVWCIAAASSPVWAKKIFPTLSEDEAVARLWEAIFRAVRADQADPAAAWEEHRAALERRIKRLNRYQFKKLTYQNAHGTDLQIGLPSGHIWAGGGARTQGGVYFFPNMPTEEIFCSPHRDETNGTVRSSLPLIWNGTPIEGISIRFENGRAVSWTADRGADALTAMIEIDEGAHYLGEVALIPQTSPIRKQNLLFYNTLFDENASCHLALGEGFSECLEQALTQTKEERLQRGLNDSASHVDFMIGTDDLSITGETVEGKVIPVFRNGDWALPEE